MKARLDDRNTGYSYWLAVDFPDSPEGCWDEGILNQLWESKPYLTEAIRDSNGPSVLLIGLDAPQRTLFADETRSPTCRSRAMRPARVAPRMGSWCPPTCRSSSR